MTAVPAPFDPAPLLTRLRWLLAVAWARARTIRPPSAARVAPIAREVASTLAELAAGAALVRGAWELAPWLGWCALAGVLGFVGWLLEPAAAEAGE